MKNLITRNDEKKRENKPLERNHIFQKQTNKKPKAYVKLNLTTFG